jgi:hypothetical protein
VGLSCGRGFPRDGWHSQEELVKEEGPHGKENSTAQEENPIEENGTHQEESAKEKAGKATGRGEIYGSGDESSSGPASDSD